ncbi:MAG: hypothetical protein RLZ55_1758, partial [Actinomycetota bacterium]
MSGVPGPEWRWDGSEWWWWNGSTWVEAGVAPAEPPPHPDAGAAQPRRGRGVGGLVAIVLGVVLVLVLVGGGVAVYVVKSRSGTAPVSATASPSTSDVVTLQTEPLSTATSPFTPPVGSDRAVTPVKVQGVQSAPAETVGLFGGTMNNATCDKSQLVSFLQANPEKAAAWAQALGIPVAQIPAFVAPLTPVLLRSDTTVTNHGFVNGTLTTVTSVLQAGTAVLVNQYGQPVVKCYCGNPLGPPPPLKQVRYTGPTWPDFQPGSLTIIQSSTTIINDYTIVNVENNTTFVRPAGTDGRQDQPSNVQPPTDPIPSTAPEPVTPEPVVPEPIAPTPVLPTPEPSAPSSGGTEQQAIALVKDTYRSCAVAIGRGGEAEEVIAAASFNAAPAATAHGAFTVTVSDGSG